MTRFDNQTLATPVLITFFLDTKLKNRKLQINVSEYIGFDKTFKTFFKESD